MTTRYNGHREVICHGMPDDAPEFDFECPTCGAKPGDECTSIVSGCCIEGMHSARWNLRTETNEK